MKALAIVVLLLTAAPALANTTPAQRGEPNTTPAQRAQAVENDDFDEWGLLGLLGLAGLLGLRRRKDDDRVDPTVYTTTNTPPKAGF